MANVLSRKKERFDAQFDLAPPVEPKDLYASTQRMATQYFETANLSRSVWEVVRHVAPTTDRLVSSVHQVVGEVEADFTICDVRLVATLADQATEEDELQFLQLWSDIRNKPRLRKQIRKYVANWQEEQNDNLPGFLDQSQRLAEYNQIDAALDIVYDQIDEMLLAGKFEDLDELLAEVYPGGLALEVSLAVLTATLPARLRLANRATFYTRVESTLRERGELRDGLLVGLE
jgi:hypothetical protein